MYRYLLFMYDDFYPCGGMEDVKLKFNESEELMEWANNYDKDCIGHNIIIYDSLNDRECHIKEFSNIEKEFRFYQFGGMI